MVVTEEIDNISDLGVFIYQLCVGKETFKLQRREKIIGEYFILNFYCISGYEKETKGREREICWAFQSGRLCDFLS